MTDTYRLRPEVLDRVRERHGLTSDEQVAHLIGVSAGTVHRIRRGETPSFATAIKLLNEAGMTLAGIQKIKTPAA